MLAALGRRLGAWFGGGGSVALLDAWRLTLANTGLRVVRAHPFPAPHLEATDDLLRVIFDTVADGRRDSGTRILVARRDGRPFGLELRLESAWTEIEKRRGAVEVEVGERDFDDAFSLRGETAAVLAALDDRTRRLLRAFALESAVEIVPDWIRSASPAAEEARLGSHLRRLLELGRRLSDARPLVERLAANATSDRFGGVRLRNVVCLAAEFPRDERARAALRTAMQDPVPEIRLRAALALAEEGFATVAALAEDDAVPDECAAHALAAAAPRLGEERVLAILHRGLRTRRVESASACLAALAGGTEAAVRALSKVTAIERGRLASAAAQALGAAPHPLAERALGAVLEDDDADPDARLAAAESLGRIGTVASVPGLAACARAFRGERALQRAVRQAIAEIQSRRTGAEHGQVSLADGESGGLTLVEGAGRLSLAPAAQSTRRGSLP